MKKIVRTICQGSHMECGVRVHVEDGKITKIEGDPGNPVTKGFICPKGRVQHQFTYHPDRLKYPLRRVGERGSGKWERISWDEALDDIAGKLTEVKDKYGAQSIATMHGTGPRASLYSTQLLACALGSPNVISTDVHICYVPSMVGQKATWGPQMLMDVGPDYANANCIMIVGGNPLLSHPPRGAEVLKAKRERNAKLIVVDPRRTELAAKADLWLQIRPGTDVVMALGMIRTIIDEGWYDKAFVSQWCYGFDELKERVKEYPVEKCAELTWIPADKIREAARLYATTKPAAMHHRVAVEQNLNSTQTVRSLAILAGLTGNVDIPGGNLINNHVQGLITSAELLGAGPVARPSKELELQRIGAAKYPMSLGPDAPLPMVYSPLAQDAMRDGKLKAIFSAGSSICVNGQNSKEIWNLLKDKLDLFIVSDFFMIPDTGVADYVLPAATWLERDDTCDFMYINCVGIRQKCIEPLYETKHDVQMTIELVKRIPWADRKYVPWKDVDAYNEAVVRGTGRTFAQAKEEGYISAPLEYKKYEKGGFPTPTKKIEFYSKWFEKYGYDPLPCYIEPPESPVSTPELIKDYPLILFTGSRTIEYYHSMGRMIPELRKRNPDPVIQIHPETAQPLGVSDGDWVWLETPQVKGERVKLKARITTDVHPKMVHAYHGWWFPENPSPDHGCFESNVNVVLSDVGPREAVCCSLRLRGTLCRVYKV